MKKIILIIFMAMISSFSYYGVVNEKGEKVVDFTTSSQEENIVVSETAQETQKNITDQVENTVAQTEKIQKEKTKVQETTKEQIPTVVEKTNKSDNTNKNKEIKQAEVTQPKQDSQVKETEVNNSNTTEKKKETNTNINQNKNTNNTNNIPKCTHSNSNWYNSKAEAEAIYNAEIKKWGDKWTNYEIDSETYYKNCPSGYEVFSCPYCNKWTINLYY